MSYPVVEAGRYAGTPYGAGPSYQVVLRRSTEADAHYFIPLTRRPEGPAVRFRRLAQIWREERGPMSSLTEMVMHPAYQEIIGMGRDAVPLLLRELEREPDHWFAALRAITGVDPVPSTMRGRVRQMAQAWLTWAREQRLRW